MGSNFPGQLDNDITLPQIVNNISQIGGQAINAARSSIFAIENSLGVNAWAPGMPFYGTASNLGAFLSVAHNPNGTINPSALTGLGLVTLPITDSEISPTAGIQETKIDLAYNTTTLYSYINQVNASAQQTLNFITYHGSKIEPHIAGTEFNHLMSAILVANSNLNYFYDSQKAFRNNSNLYSLFNDINNDLITHEVANNQPVIITTGGQYTGGTLPPTDYAHVAAGLYLNTSNFSFIPQTATDLQQFAEFIDNSNIFILGSRIQTLYANGIPRTAISPSLVSQSQGQLIVPSTTAIAYLVYAGGVNGSGSAPVDSIDNGDDLVEFIPPAASIANNTFDAQFLQVKVGDVLTVNYGSFSVSQIVTEIKYTVSLNSPPVKRYVVRINGKNILAQNVTATVTRSLSNNEKYGVLALAQANPPSGSSLPPTLIIGNPRGAEVLSINFNPNLIDNTHYNLYLTVYPDGNPLDSIFNMPAIDISGNQGGTPGAYTLASIVQSMNNQFRTPGYNNRFIAFEYQGELGLKMSDSFNNISFSITDGAIDPTTGLYNQSLSTTLFPENAIGVPGFDPIDATGLGPNGAAVSGPQFTTSYSTPQAAATTTKIIVPLALKNYYVDGVERERFAIEPGTSLDGYGDSYWPATILTKTVLTSRTEVTYQVDLNLANSGLAVGKTLTVVPTQLLGGPGNFVDAGRFFISAVQFNNCDGCGVPENIVSTNITVYDAVQSPNGTTPYASAPVGTAVNLYFSPDAVGFDAENVSDSSAISPFKRLMEIYIDSDGYTFGHERARMYIGNNNTALTTAFGSSYTGFFGLPIGSPTSQIPLFGATPQSLTYVNVVEVSPKLTGFSYGTINKINLQLTSYNISTGEFDGYLCNYSISGGVTNLGPVTFGKCGDITRFYDQTNVNYIDLLFDLNLAPSGNISNALIDIQIFPTLRLDNDVFLLGTAQLNTSANTLQYLTDRRQFGNISTVQLSDEAIDFIQAAPKYLQQNGIVRGFDFVSTSSNQVSLAGGLALVNGQFTPMNNAVVTIPYAKEVYSATQYNINWLLCVNQENEFNILPLTDYDPILATPNAPNRLVSLLDVVTSQSYSVDSTTFDNMLNARKDLTPLYVIASTVTGSGGSATIALNVQDIRKYVVDCNSLAPPILTDQLTQGNFRTLAAALMWFKFNSAYQNTLHIKSNYTLATSVSGYPSILTFIGDGDQSSIVIDSSDSEITVSNINFTNLNFQLLSTLYVGSNCTFTNCTFTANNASQTPTAIEILGTASNVSFIGCTGNYVPSISGTNYSASNLINDGYGLIYCAVNTLQNFNVSDCVFTTTTATRFPFISLQYLTTTAVAQNLYIGGNQFYNTSTSDDIYAVISINSNQPSATQPTEGMKLIDCIIENNICDKNQMISISSVAAAGSPLVINNLIVAIGLVINRNMCGTISITAGTDYERNYETLSNGLAFSKKNGTTISNNTCKYIGNLEGTGLFIDGLSYVWFASNVATAPSFISNNTTSFIAITTSSISTAFYDQANSSIISNNSLKAFNTTYLDPFFASTPPSDFNVGICVRYSTIFGEQPTTPVISGNRISSGYYLTPTSTAPYSYNFGISTNQPGPIINNVINGVATGGTLIQSGTGGGTTISGNYLYRNTTHINAYIVVDSSTSIISENFFDSTTIDGDNIALVSGFGAGSSIYANNINYGGAATIVQPQFYTQITGFTTPAVGVLASAAGTLCAVYWPLVGLPNGGTLTTVQLPVTYTGTLAGGGQEQLEIVQVTGTSSNVVASWNFPSSGSSPLTVTGAPNVLINTSTSAYYLALLVLSSETANFLIYSPTLIFG